MRHAGLLLLVAACAKPVATPATSAGQPPSTREPVDAKPGSFASAVDLTTELGDRVINVELVDASAQELLTVVEQITKKSVMVDAGALHALSCATVSLHLRAVNGPILLDRVAVALRPKGFLFQSGGEGFVVKLDPNVSEPRCSGDPDPARAEHEDPVDLDVVRAEIRAGQKMVTANERTLTKKARDLLRKHAARLFDHVRILPEVTNGKIQGLRIAPERGEPILHGLGLRAGDVVSAINDRSLIDPSVALDAYKAMREADVVTVTVLRNGKTERVTIRMVE